MRYRRWAHAYPFLLVGVIALSCYILLQWFLTSSFYTTETSYRIENFSNYIPKIVWCYWDNPDNLPVFVKLCMHSWKKYSPEYEIRMITKETVKVHSTFLAKNTELLEHPRFNSFPARFSDLVRVCTLAEHGGVWMDASSLLSMPFDDWLINKPGKEYYGFYLDGFTKDSRFPIIENWFFACPPGSEFVRRWRDEFITLKNFSFDAEYIKNVKARGVNIDGIPESMQEYLSQHAAAQVVLQEQEYPLDRLSLRKAEDGPYKYLVVNGWKNYDALKAACADPRLRIPFLKVRSVERNVLEKHPDEFLNSKCHWT